MNRFVNVDELISIIRELRDDPDFEDDSVSWMRKTDVMNLTIKIIETIVATMPGVRCKDCKYWERDVIFQDGWCRGKHQGNPEWYCADGERREDDEL